MGNQKVVRTTSMMGIARDENTAYKELESLLKEGYKVVMCNPIGNLLEYILEKEDQPQEYVVNVNYEVIPGKVDMDKIHTTLVEHINRQSLT